MNDEAKRVAIDAAFELWNDVEDRMQPPDSGSPDYYQQLIAQRVTCVAVALIAAVIAAEYWASQRGPLPPME